MNIILKNQNFGNAIEALKQGKLAAREGWNGKGMYLRLIKGDALTKTIDELTDSNFPVLDAIYMKTADNKLVPWLASQTDVLAEDWVIGLDNQNEFKPL